MQQAPWAHVVLSIEPFDTKMVAFPWNLCRILVNYHVFVLRVPKKGEGGRGC